MFEHIVQLQGLIIRHTVPVVTKLQAVVIQDLHIILLPEAIIEVLHPVVVFLAALLTPHHRLMEDPEAHQGIVVVVEAVVLVAEEVEDKNSIVNPNKEI